MSSGGLCLKTCKSMTENRGSMAGAAVVLAAIKTLAERKVGAISDIPTDCLQAPIINKSYFKVFFLGIE